MATTGNEREIRPEHIVAEVLERYPWLLETFVAAGFTPLGNPIVRHKVARFVTIGQACAKMGVDLDRFLATLNARCRNAE